VRKYILHNLDCAHCAAFIESTVRDLPYVRSVSIDYSTQTMLIDTTDVDAVKLTIQTLEPNIRVSDAHHAKQTDNNDTTYAFHREMFLLGCSLVLMSAALLLPLVIFPFSDIFRFALFISAYFLIGWNVLFDAVRSIGNGSLFNENFLMTIATVGAFIINAPAEAVSVMIFFKIGELFQERALHASRRSIKALLEIRPDYANREKNGVIERVEPESIAVGDIVCVKPGEKIPVDGVVVSGESLVDTSPLTGESLPKSIHPKDHVYAGTINTTGLIKLHVTRPYTESSVSKILELVENATHKKAKAEKFMTTFARYYTPAIVIIALAIAFLPSLFTPDAILRDWVYKALVVLVISCPCALVISIPLGYFGGIGGASKRGILVKGSAFLDTLTRLKTIVFDKTGTLTHGTFRIRAIHPQNDFSESDLLRFAAYAEAHSSHPIAHCIRSAYNDKIDEKTIIEHKEIGGYGVTATINSDTVMVGNDRLLHEYNIPHDQCHFENTVAHIVVNSVYAGYILIGDTLKPTTIHAIDRIKKHGITRLIILSGDNEFSVRHIAQELGIVEYYADLLPENKVEKLEKILSEHTKGHATAFVGDGINDAPVLTRADVGIAMGALGADAAVETADIVLMDDSLEKVADALDIAFKTRKIVVQNITMAMIIKISFVCLGLFGISGMWEAVFADVGVALLAIVNAMRILR